MLEVYPWQTQDIPEEILTEVKKLYHTPYLFGSRSMSQYWPWKNKAEGSDWDFAFPYQGSEYDERKKTGELGWEPKEKLKYLDDLSFAVYEKEISGHKVQMCSKINLSIFIKVWETIEPDFYWQYLHKSSPDVLDKNVQTSIFNQLYKTAGY